MWHTGRSLVEVSVKIIYARTANDRVTMLESAIMWQLVIIVISPGTLFQNAQPSLYAGIVVNLATQLATVPMREFATLVGRLDISTTALSKTKEDPESFGSKHHTDQRSSLVEG